MKNIELKILLKKFNPLNSILKKMGVKLKNHMYQVDTYYNYKRGKIKIREINNKNFELIFYQRPDKYGSKISNYKIYKINKNQLKHIKNQLKSLLGEKNIVTKKRDLYLYKNTRIHLDKVKNLGNFLELETIVKNSSLRQAKKEHNLIKKLLGLNNYKNINKSYCDILLSKKLSASN